MCSQRSWIWAALRLRRLPVSNCRSGLALRRRRFSSNGLSSLIPGSLIDRAAAENYFFGGGAGYACAGLGYRCTGK